MKTTFGTWVMRQNGQMMITGNCQYGAQRRKADATYHRQGAYDLMQSRFLNLARHNAWCIAHANKHGYVETIPDKTVDPKRGYPLVCRGTGNGGVMPTLPLNYRTSGTAMWITRRAMVKCHEQLKEWQKQGFDGYMALQIHDELLFDFPKSRIDPRVDPKRSNLGRIRVLKRLMESVGEDLVVRIPSPVNVEYHPSNWSEAFTMRA